MSNGTSSGGSGGLSGSQAPDGATSEPGRLARPLTSENHGWGRWLPGVQTARRYELAWLSNDVVAGLVLTTMLVPVGIAYAVASGVPGICGLYATIVPLLAYALFGPSRILVLAARLCRRIPVHRPRLRRLLAPSRGGTL